MERRGRLKSLSRRHFLRAGPPRAPSTLTSSTTARNNPGFVGPWYPDWRGLLTIMFARNDWLTGGVVSSLARNELLRRALNDATEKLAGSDLELDRPHSGRPAPRPPAARLLSKPPVIPPPALAPLIKTSSGLRVHRRLALGKPMVGTGTGPARVADSFVAFVIAKGAAAKQRKRSSGLPARRDRVPRKSDHPGPVLGVIAGRRNQSSRRGRRRPQAQARRRS